MSDERTDVDGTAEGSVQILLAVRDEQVRQSFEKALGTYPRGADLHVCTTSDEVLERIGVSRPEVALISVDIQPDDGFRTIEQMAGRVSGVSTLLITKSSTPEDFRKALRAGARDMLQIPVAKDELFAAIDAAVDVSRGKRSALESLVASGQKAETPRATGIAVFSTKGGTGKTFIATNLAAGLARAGRRVALVDLDLQFGDAALALGMVPERTIYDLVSTYTDFDMSLVADFMLKHTSGLHLLPAPLYPDQAENVTIEDLEAVLEVLRGGYEYVVVDTPPFFEDRILVALEWADHIVQVGSMDLPSLKNMKVSFTMMDLMAYPREKLRVVMNRADSRVGLDVAQAEKHLGVGVDHLISSSIEVPRALNAGETLVLSKPGLKISQELGAIVRSFEKPSANGHDKKRRSLLSMKLGRGTDGTR